MSTFYKVATTANSRDVPEDAILQFVCSFVADGNGVALNLVFQATALSDTIIVQVSSVHLTFRRLSASASHPESH